MERERLESADRGQSEQSAIFFTLIETAKANGLERYGYVRYLFEQLPLTTNEQGYRRSLPQNVDRDNVTVEHTYSKRPKGVIFV